MSGSGCCFLTCIQISQEAGKVVWYSHLFKNLPEFVVIHTVKGFGIVNKAEVDVFLRFSCFFYDPKWICGVGREEKNYILCGKQREEIVTDCSAGCVERPLKKRPGGRPGIC